MTVVPDIPYRVRWSTRARRVRVWVHPDGEVEVVLPERSPARAAGEAMRELAPWIERQRAKAVADRVHVAQRPEGVVPYLGSELMLRPEPGRTRVHRRGDVLLVPEGDPREALERWYRRAAREAITPKLDEAVQSLDVSYQRVTIRNQRTRWGSCSTMGGMSFNWRLMLAPEPVLDYVVWHEACHLRVMDHSPRFWALLEQRLPGYREQRWWLRRYGGTLVL